MLDILTLVEQRTLDPLPEARPATKEKMLALTALFDVPVDIWPARTGVLPAGCWWLPQAQLFLCGTACARPMLFDEVRQIATATALSAIIVRDQSVSGLRTRYTFDLWHEGRWHVPHLLWISEGGSGWLIPDLGGGPYLRLSQWGPDRTDAAPFSDLRDRFAGLDRAADYLAGFTRRR